MAPRITLNLTDVGELEIWINEEGRDLLVQKLEALGETSEHFHLGAFGDAEVKVRANAYRPTDEIINSAKVLFRTDEWDRRYYSHVLDRKD
jgi:hypothetical protein